MHLDLRTLRHFIALMDHGSFAAAAAAVNLSQSAFSRSIQNLEAQTGHLLVDRAQKHLPPTAQGQLLLHHARGLLLKAQTLTEALGAFSAQGTGRVQFGCGPSLAVGLVPRAIAAFMAGYPRARVYYKVDHWRELGQRLRNHEIEFLIADTRYFEAEPQYAVTPLHPQSWHFYCRQGHPLAGRGAVTCAEVFSYPLATSFQPFNIRKVLAEFSADPHFTPTVESANNQSLFNIVALTDAVGILTQDCRASLVEQGAHVLDISDMPAALRERHTHNGIVQLRAERLSPLASALVQVIEEQDQPMQPSLRNFSI
ncbi:LysR family transcriptional regulator [Pseudomonas typographi]|uniref:LysR substrate-binding domain-containing protein n=1 Tax=Pseudomonas typographi TaxID=2715964 RepID=UPI001685C3FF|nr:LysR family transcriptional regulator [Pseudomonas typographi]MBD1552606.1 LysR family transcriptional regulator [Pseudomonas typographi]MBD1586187.1 LysR family transcriptional regulator [Pseudomonas typographi]